MNQTIVRAFVRAVSFLLLLSSHFFAHSTGSLMAFQETETAPPLVYWTYDSIDDALISREILAPYHEPIPPQEVLLRKTNILMDGSIDEDSATELRLPNVTGSLIRKGDFYFALNVQTPEIHVIGVEGFESAGTIAIGEMKCIAIACSEADNSFIYALSTDPKRRIFLQQIDIVERKVVGSVMVSDFGGLRKLRSGFRPTTLAINSTGMLAALFPKHLFSLQEEPFIAKPVAKLEAISFRSAIDFHGRFIQGQPGKLLDANLDLEGRDLNQEERPSIIAIHPTKDIYARFEFRGDKAALTLGQFSTNEALHKETFDFEPASRFNFAHLALAWRSDDSLVIGCSDKPLLVNQSALVARQPVRLSITRTPDSFCQLGKSVSQKLRLDFPVSGTTTFTIKDGPKSTTSAKDPW